MWGLMLLLLLLLLLFVVVGRYRYVEQRTGTQGPVYELLA